MVKWWTNLLRIYVKILYDLNNKLPNNNLKLNLIKKV